MTKETAKKDFQKFLESYREAQNLPKDAPEYKLIKNFLESAIDLDAHFCFSFCNPRFKFQLANAYLEEFIAYTAAQIYAYDQSEEDGDDLTWDEIIAKIQLRIMEFEAKCDKR